MPDVLDIDAAAGLLAVYTSPGAGTDDAPLYSPPANLSRIKLHSSLDYPKVVSVFTGTKTLAGLAANTRRNTTYVLAAHGRAGIPWVFATATLGGVPISLSGSVPVFVDTPQTFFGATNNQGFPWMVAIGADATNILLHENTMTPYGPAGPWPSVSFAWKVFVTDTIL